MAYYVTQFRYYGRNNANNYPANISPENLGNGSIFNNYIPITQLGIQYTKEKPIRFYINGSDSPIITGAYGLYELDLTGKTSIHSLHFEQDQIATEVIEKNPLIIDIVYER